MNKTQIKDSEKTIYAAFKKHKRKFFINMLLSILVTFAGIAIFGLQLFYPYHFSVAFVIYLLSFIPLLKNIYLSRKTIKEYKEYAFAASFIKKQKVKIIIAISLTILAAAFFTVRPADENPFFEMSAVEINQVVQEDIHASITVLDYLESTGNVLLQSLETEEQNTEVSKNIKNNFDDFLNAVLLSESFTDKHRYFDNIPGELEAERSHSFIISYSLYLKKYEIVHRLLSEVSADEYKKKIFNQHVYIYNRSDIYNEMVLRYYHPKTGLRINGGKLYLKTLQENDNPVYKFLENESEKSYTYLKSNVDKTIYHSADVYLSDFKKRMFDFWFPIQKGVANTMGHIVISERGNTGIIDPVDVVDMQLEMEPGDIMLQRRNWHMTNVGIPGFWTHAAVYVGDFEYTNNYFESVFPYKGFNNLKELLEKEYPGVYQQYQGSDILGDYAVIEAIEPGVVFQSLEKSADADFVVVLRPNVEKLEKLESLLTAFENLGKPYDYNFDFDTRDALVCSELVYDMYYPEGENKGLHFETEVINGRKIVAPLDMAKKFRDEKDSPDRELDFVYFLKSDEDSKTTSVGTEDDFIESIGWSKFTFLH